MGDVDNANSIILTRSSLNFIVTTESQSLVNLHPDALRNKMGELLQNNVDQLKLLSFSNAIMMETNLSACLLHLIDAIFDATSAAACSIFILDDSMQSMDEYRHNAYRDDRPERTMSARTGIGQQVLSCQER